MLETILNQLNNNPVMSLATIILIIGVLLLLFVAFLTFNEMSIIFKINRKQKVEIEKRKKDLEKFEFDMSDPNEFKRYWNECDRVLSARGFINVQNSELGKVGLYFNAGKQPCDCVDDIANIRGEALPNYLIKNLYPLTAFIILFVILVMLWAN